MTIIIVIKDNVCIALFSGVHKLTALYNILQYFPMVSERDRTKSVSYIYIVSRRSFQRYILIYSTLNRGDF